tara:strand:- start:131 stop:1327 length:1197 start_codon:yes stop_codon:yes gene_type:complete
MAEKNKEVLEEVTKEQVEQPKEEVVENKIDESKFESAGDDSIIKIDLSNPPVRESEEVKQEESAEEEKVDVVEEPVAQEEIPVLEEITEEDLKEVKEETIDKVEETVKEAVIEAKETGKPLPENIQKLVNFMDETGGDIQDYVNLNRDISKMDNSDILDEYYRATKSHLNAEERSFMLEERFNYDEDVDDPKEIKRKKIALKEQVAEAKAYLDGQKSKYYEDIKAGSKLTQEQQKAIDFFNRHNKESEEQKKLNEASLKDFNEKTNKVFNDKFKGFDFKVGDKKYRFNVKDVDKVKTTQSNINNFINMFSEENDSTIKDATGYHKSLFTAMNADAIANHFYEQGKADAIKNRVAKDKNINLNPRQTHGEVNVGGVKYRVLGDSSSDMKNRSFKIRKKN